MILFMTKIRLNLPLVSAVVAVLAELAALVVTQFVHSPPLLVGIVVVGLVSCCFALIQQLRRLRA